MASTSETGLQLFARLVARPSLVGLEDALFPQGPGPKEVVELNGDSGSGKTLLLSQFTAKCILPKEWKGLSIGGLKAGVVLLNTDHHFQMYKLISLMESRLREVNESFTVTDVEQIVKESLERLIIYNIADSQQLEVTLFALQNVVSSESDIGLILLDSVSAFYWQDAMTSGTKKMNTYVKNVLKMIQKSLIDLKGVIMYTRPSYFQSTMTQTLSCNVDTGMGNVNRRITLKEIEGSENNFSASVDGPTGRYTKLYSIDASGVKWK